MNVQEVFDRNYTDWLANQGEWCDEFEEIRSTANRGHSELVIQYAEHALAKKNVSPFYVGYAAAGLVEDYVNKLVSDNNLEEMRYLYSNYAIRYMVNTGCVWGNVEKFIEVVHDRRH